MCSSVTLLRLSAALVFLYAVISWVLFTGLWLLSGDVASLKLGGVKVLTFVASPVDAVVVWIRVAPLLPSNDLCSDLVSPLPNARRPSQERDSGSDAREALTGSTLAPLGAGLVYWSLHFPFPTRYLHFVFAGPP
jgi:hypothetical protein